MFLFRGKESHPRSIVKAITWRVLGSIDTFVLSLIVTGDVRAAGAIASIETVTKIVLYYFHERVWSGIRWGQQLEPGQAPAVDEPSAEPGRVEPARV